MGQLVCPKCQVKFSDSEWANLFCPSGECITAYGVEPAFTFEELVAFRQALLFSEDTRHPATPLPIRSGSAGHCAAVAVLFQKRFGGNLVSAKVNGQSHWFNRVGDVQGGESGWDIDLTGDQFIGERTTEDQSEDRYYIRSFLEIDEAGKLWDNTRVRDIVEINQETLDRAKLLAERSGLSCLLK